jgi:hypothetical protein
MTVEDYRKAETREPSIRSESGLPKTNSIETRVLLKTTSIDVRWSWENIESVWRRAKIDYYIREM